MALKSLIFHRIEKWQEDGDVQTSQRDDSHAISADPEAFFNALRKNFNGKAGKSYGKFQDDYATHPFSRWLEEFLDEKISFARLSQLYLEQLKLALQAAPVCLGGSLVMALDQRPEGHDLFCFLVSETSSFKLNTQLDLEVIDHLDPAHVDVAARIEIDAWRGKHRSDSYFTVAIGGGAKARAEVILHALGFVSAVDTKQETTSLLQTVEQYAASLSQDEAPKCRKQVYDYCVEQDQFGEPVELETLSRLLNESAPEAFAEFARAQENPLGDEIHPDRRKLKSLVRFSGKVKGVTLSFSSDAIDQTIHYDPRSGSLTIRELPAALKQQLNRYIQREAKED